MKKMFNFFSPKYFFLGAVVAFVSGGIFLLALNIMEKKNEAKHSNFIVREINALEDDPKVWGESFPQQYEDYLKTVDQVRTRHGGSEALPHRPTSSDPRTQVSQSKLEEDHRLVTMWLGYAFSKDFREERGHAYMLEDQIYTGRQSVPQPGTCLNCHASTYKAMMVLGEGDLNKGFEAMNTLPYHEAVKNVKHPVSCIDCHNPKDMSLRVTRPAFIEGIAEYKKTLGVHNFDVNKMATRQEMKTFVCAQCHVEYYFKGDKKRLTFPWSKGIKADQILSYYEDVKFKDWVHKVTGANMLKAQHPEFEMWSQGTHAKAGVSCTDCHMPYKRVGAKKYSDHHVRSPMLNINRACQTCHNVSEDELFDRVATIQDRHIEMRDMALNTLMELIKAIETAQKNGVAKEKLDKARDFHRKASFLVDFVEAENSTGFHAPQEAARVLMMSLDYSRKGIESL